MAVIEVGLGGRVRLLMVGKLFLRVKYSHKHSGALGTNHERQLIGFNKSDRGHPI